MPLLCGPAPALAQRWNVPLRPVRLRHSLPPLPQQLVSRPGVPEPLPFLFDRPGRRQVVLPLTVQRNLLIVSFMVNGIGPLNFMLDSGVGTAILTDPNVADSLRLRRGQPYRVVGSGGEDAGLLAHEVEGVRLSANHVVGPSLRMLALSEDVLNLSGYVGMPIHGILGSELFRSFVVSVEPEAHRLVLTAPDRYRAPRGGRWASLPLTIIAHKAYLHLPVQVSDSLALPLRLVLDTGAGHALSLEAGSAPQLQVPPQRLRTDLGRGLSGFIRGYLGRVTALQLGRYRLPAVLTSFPDSNQVRGRVTVPRNGNVGFELLKRFSVVIDYPHRRLLLRPNAQYREPFEHDMCGLDLVAAGPDFRRYLVLRVTPDSPAASAGLLANDELVSINLLPTNMLSMTQLSRLFHSYDGRALLLLVRRADGELHTVTLRLRRQI
ncbi:PDZ domain-containing protein [uncultured Hymenobacter sp.]|uniref:PDZ domain-containing protein n=1 Tax=uncultured Hymenobacter sp. TaxID=170016 RepID=UPI0035C944B6